MNTICISGTIAREFELKTTQSGKSVVSFTIAHNDGWGDNKKTYWIDVVAWNGVADNAAKFFHKGSRVFITGKLTTRSYETKDGQKRTVTEIVANTIDFGDSKKSDNASTGGASQFGEKTDEVPFF